jgi:hypothetical protein
MTDEHTAGGRVADSGGAAAPPAGDAGSSTLIGFIAAGALFMVMLAFTLHYVGNARPGGADLDTQLSTRAEEVLRLTVEEPGFTSTGATSWHESPDDLDRFGLAQDGNQNVLEWDKLQELRDGLLEADDSNGEPDYPEVRDDMGLDEETNFHIRTRPLFIPLDSSSWGPNPNLEVGYVAHGTSGSSNDGTVNSHSGSSDGDTARWDVTVENTGSQAMVYKVTFELEAGDELILTDEDFTGKLSTGETETVSLRAYEVDEWDGDTAHVNATVYDAWSNEQDNVTFSSVDLPADGDDSSDVEHNLEVSPGRFSYGPGETPTLYLDHYDHQGDRINDQGSGPDARLAVQNPSGTEIVNTTVTLENNKALEWTCDDCATTGDYTAELMTTDDNRTVADGFRNASTDEFTESKTPTGDAQYEMGLIGDLVENFDNTTHEGATHGAGDVYVDESSVLEDHMTTHLSQYDTLVVGTNVDHNAMTSGDVKWPIHDWVTEEGGHLIVLGNADPNTQWLQPLYGSGVASASGGVSTPDPSHPVLHNPEELEYDRYKDHDTAWKLRAGADDYYTHVIQKDSSGSQTEDVLAVSEPGAFGNGSVVLGSYNLSDLTDGDNEDESKKLLRNMVLESYQMVYVDYGPSIPADAAVATEKRAAAIPHPSLPGNTVEVKVITYVWK